MRTTLLAVPLLVLAACDVSIAGDGTVSGSFPGLDAKAEKTVDAALDLKAGDTIDVSSDFGAIRLRVDDAAKPSATARIVVRAKTDEEAKRVLATWKLVATKSGAIVMLRAEGDAVEAERSGTKISVGPEVDLEVVVPASTRARAKSQSGSVRADGAFASVDLRTKFGRVEAAGARGEVVLETQSGEVVVDDATGPRIDARSQFGGVKLRKIVAPKVVAHSESGEVSCEATGAGDYDLTTSFGAVKMRGGSGTLVAKTQSGKADVEGFDGRVTAISEFGDVEVEGVLTVVEARTQSGSVKVSAKADSKAESGWTVRSNFGGVTLRVPETFACELELSTEFGSLKADHPGVGREPDKGAKEMRAKVGAGGAAVVLRTQSGSAKFESSSR
jgi:DUF4097 and DUF4098 domain-containing protein YvlB